MDVASTTGVAVTRTRSLVSTQALVSLSESKRYAPRTVSPARTSIGLIASGCSTSCVVLVTDAMRQMPRIVPSGACTRSQCPAKYGFTEAGAARMIVDGADTDCTVAVPKAGRLV